METDWEKVLGTKEAGDPNRYLCSTCDVELKPNVGIVRGNLWDFAGFRLTDM